jgi:hypothetical protein
MADERSYDDTEPTPEPYIFRPPLPSQYPRDEASPNTSLLEQSLFSFSADGTLDDDEDGEQSSLPSFPQEPPSPLSRPSLSLLDEDTSRLRPGASASSGTRSRQPPMSEVHVQEDDDTFFECVEDRSLARRTRRSLLATPKSKASLSAAASTQSNASVDLSLSQIHPSTLAAAAVHKSPIARSSPQNVSQTRSIDVSSDDVVRVHGNALQALVQMKEELIKAHEANHALEQEKRTSVQDRDAVERKLHDYQVKQREELEGLSKEREEWFHEKNDLELQLRTAAREKKDSMHRKLAADNRQKQWKSQLDDIKVELEEALAEKEVLASDLARVQKHNKALQNENQGLSQQLESQVAADSKKIRELRLETEQKDNAISQLKAALDARKEEAERLRKKLLKYKEALKEANDAMKSKPALKSPSSRSGRSFASTSVRFQEDDHAVLETSIADRLAKMRDSAERAHMIRVHKREVSRLKVDKESEMQKLVAEHEEVMRKANKETTSTLNAKLEEVKTTLKEEYDEKAAELEKRHNQKFAEVRKFRIGDISTLQRKVHGMLILFLFAVLDVTDAKRVFAQSGRCRRSLALCACQSSRGLPRV